MLIALAGCRFHFDELQPGQDGAPGSCIVQLEAGRQHFGLVDRRSRVFTWGGNAYAQLGDRSMTDRATPVQIALPMRVASIGVGRYETCAALADGTAMCWGEGLQGQLGDGLGMSSATPVVVDGLTGVVEVAPAAVHACARLTNGSVWCWGEGEAGRLGRGSMVYSLVPAQSMVVGATRLVAGGSTTCVILEDRTVRCWGFNGEGGIGDNTTNNALRPVEPLGLGAVRSISTRDTTTCAVRSDGDVYCWGGNGFGQVASGTTGGTVLVPVPARTASGLLTGADEVAVGIEHGCARLGSEVWCWGNNTLGQLGTGNIDNGRPLAARVEGLPAITRIAVGAYTTCAIDGSDGVWCWGAGSHGELGSGVASAMQPVPARSFVASCE